MSKKLISIMLICIIAFGMMAALASCTGLFPTTQATTSDGVTETTEAPTGWRF